MAALVLFVTTLGSCTKDSPLESTDIAVAQDLIKVEEDSLIENRDIMIAQNVIEVENELLGIVNDHRISLGKSQLQFSEVAYEHANAHNNYMVSKGKISHDNFNLRASKISLETDAKAVGENVAKGYSNANQVFEGWLNSSGHRATIEGDFTHTAVSVKKNSNGDYYFTQLFFKE